MATAPDILWYLHVVLLFLPLACATWSLLMWTQHWLQTVPALELQRVVVTIRRGRHIVPTKRMLVVERPQRLLRVKADGYLMCLCQVMAACFALVLLPVASLILGGVVLASLAQRLCATIRSIRTTADSWLFHLSCSVMSGGHSGWISGHFVAILLAAACILVYCCRRRSSSSPINAPRSLFIRAFGSGSIHIEDVEDHQTVRDVILHVCAKYGMHVSPDLKLYLAGRRLPLGHRERVVDLGLDALSTLTLSVALKGGARGAAANTMGNNQWGAGSIAVRFPELPDIVQQCLDKGDTRDGVLKRIKREHPHIPSFSARTLGNIIRDYNLRTSRNPQLTVVEAGAAILEYIETDIVRRQGPRKVHRELRKGGTHMPRDFVHDFLSVVEPEKCEARHPGSKKVHTGKIERMGPNEEWSCDGHLKLVPEMGLYVWGIVDVYSRHIQQHFVLRDASVMVNVRALYLRVAKKYKGIPFKASFDQGSETGHAAALQIYLRQHFHDADVKVYPAYSGLKSVYNITVERQWRPLYDEILENILIWFRAGLRNGVYHEQDTTHHAIMQWVWARVVQSAVSQWVEGRNSDHVRKQDEMLLPSGGRPDDFYYSPEDWGGVDCLVPIPDDVLDALLEEFTPPDLFQFGPPDVEAHCEAVHRIVLNSIHLDVKNAWAVVCHMITLLPM